MLARMERIASLLAAGQWGPEQAAALGAEWGLAPLTLRNMAGECARWSRLGPDAKARVRARACEALERFVEMAFEERNISGGVAALRLRLEAAGALEPDADPATMVPGDTPEEALRWLEDRQRRMLERYPHLRLLPAKGPTR